jgi:hypothetical protein
MAITVYTLEIVGNNMGAYHYSRLYDDAAGIEARAVAQLGVLLGVSCASSLHTTHKSIDKPVYDKMTIHFAK